MTIRDISDIFKTIVDDIDEVKSYNFGWASDRTRVGNTEDYQELNNYPRVFFTVPTITQSNQIRKQDTYQVTVFVDDLLGYDNEGDSDLTLQIDKWSDLQLIATKFIQRINALKQSLLPDYVYIPEPPEMVFDSFVSLQRLITVQLNFNIVVPTNCEAQIQRQVLVFANLLGQASLQAGLSIVIKVSSQMTGSASLEANIQLTKLASAALSASASLSASALISKLASSSLTGAGTLAAELTVGSAFDADAQAFFNRVTTAGGTLSLTEQNAVNTLVIGMKADGIWTKMKAIYPMVGASAAACAQNLVSASFTGTFSSGWTFANTGVKGNGTSAFFNTLFNSQNNWTSSSNGSMGFVSRTNIEEVSSDMGAGNVFDGINSSIIFSRFNGNVFYSGLNSSVVTPGDSNASSIGFFVASRLITTSHNRYKRGTSIINSTINNNIGTIYNLNIYLGAGNHISTNSAANFSNKEFSFAFIGDGLNQTDVDNYYSKLQIFNNTLSR